MKQSPSSQFITIDGKSLEYAWHGPPPDEAPTLIFLHEGLGCVAMWRDFPVTLADATGCGALIYSRTGYGQSDSCELPRAVTFQHDEAVTVLPALIDAFEIRDAILVGHSDGGTIALIYAASAHGQTLRGVITEAAHVFNEAVCVASIEDAVELYEETDLRAKLSRYHKNVDVAFRGWADVWLHPDYRDWNMEEWLSQIKVPLLAIQGKKDQYGTVSQLRSIGTRAGGPTETLLLADCRHVPHVEQREQTLAAMKRFIDQLLFNLNGNRSASPAD